MNYTVTCTVLIPLGRKEGETVTGKELEECGIGEARAVEIGAVKAAEAVKPAKPVEPVDSKK